MKAELLAVFGSDDMVVDCARVSFSKNHAQYTEEQNARLIHYLARHRHWAPLAHPKAQFRIHAPIFVARQWEKHRIGTVRGYDIYDHSEESRRYVDADPEFYVPDGWRGKPSGSIKQGSGDVLNSVANAACDFDLRTAMTTCTEAYHHMLRRGVAPEMARMVLPQNMMTQWIETGSLYYWFNLCRLRLDSHAQKEIGDLAAQVSAAMSASFPVSWQALLDASKEVTA